MAKLFDVIGVGEGNKVVIVGKERVVQRLAGLPTNVPLVAGQQVDLEAAEASAVNAAELLAKVDSALASLAESTAELEAIKAQLLNPVP